jgi:hypothetical protein
MEALSGIGGRTQVFAAVARKVTAEVTAEVTPEVAAAMFPDGLGLRA